MRRLASVPGILAVTLTIVLASSGCAKATPPALTVNGWELSRATFLDQLDELATNDALVKLIRLTPYVGTDKSSYTTQYTTWVLNLHVQNRLFVGEVDRRGLQVDTAAAEQQIVSQIASSPSAQGGADAMQQAQALLDGAGWMKDALVTNFAYSAALQADLAKDQVTDDALHQAYDQYKAQLAQACVSHIMISVGSVDPQTGQRAPGTDAEYAAALAKANSLKAQLDAGADFATLAQKSSEDQGSAAKGGDLGCAPKGAYVAEFDDVVWSIDVGTVSAPVKTQYGYHLIKVTKRSTPSFDEARPQLEKALAAQAGQMVQSWLADEAGKADVAVDARFGDWDAGKGAVVPPPGADSPSTTATESTEVP